MNTAAPDLPFRTAALLWIDRMDSIDIARALRVSEAAIWNAMGLIRLTAHNLRQATT